VLDKGDPLYVLAVAPEFIWELALGVYLTATGGRVAGLVGHDSRDMVALRVDAETLQRPPRRCRN
jgi:hypothetical protein